MKIEVAIGGNTCKKFETKSFKDKDKAIEWCKRNANNIYSINGQITKGEVLNAFEYEAAFRNMNIAYYKTLENIDKIKRLMT